MKTMKVLGVQLNPTGATTLPATATTALPVDLKVPPAGVPLPETLERLIYFNGRFLKAEDLQIEASDRLLRSALSERAQGAGVSYGFHVTAAAKTASTSYVASVAAGVWARMQSDPLWMRAFNVNQAAAKANAANADGTTINDQQFNQQQVAQLAKAIEDVCCGGPENGGEAALTVGPGHAADGYGHDLYLDRTVIVKLSDLIKAYQASPSRCVVPGPSITPQPLSGATGALTGAFLLTAFLNFEDKGQVPIYGVQCGDNGVSACSLGYHWEGVGLQLVFFDALAGKVARPGDPLDWRGAGARAYSEAETSARGTLLPTMVSQLPFDAAAAAPDTGTHVPIGMVYLSNGAFVAYDEWAAKRLRTPAELDYWLRALLNPSKPAQVAHTVQFQSQLTDGLAARKQSVDSLWDLGFVDGATLVLPGVGFLPVALEGTSVGKDELAAIDDAVADFFDGVPYKLMPSTPGELNALFTGAIESGELRLTRVKPIETNLYARFVEFQKYAGTIDQMLKQAATAELTAAPAAAAPAPAPTTKQDAKKSASGSDAVAPAAAEAPAQPISAAFDIDEVSSALQRFIEAPVPASQPPQVFVWYPTTGYRGFVMFTWTAPLPAASAASPHLCVSVGVTVRSADVKQTLAPLATFLKPSNDKTMSFRDGEFAGGLVVASSRGSLDRDVITRFRLQLAPDFPDLTLQYSGLYAVGTNQKELRLVTVYPNVADGWVRKPTTESTLFAFRVSLSGPAAADYDVRYRARMSSMQGELQVFYDFPWVQNGVASIGTNDLSGLNPADLQAILTHMEVKIVPHCDCGTTAASIGIVTLTRGQYYTFATQEKGAVVGEGQTYDVRWADALLVASSYRGNSGVVRGSFYSLGQIGSVQSVTTLSAKKFTILTHKPTLGEGIACRIVGSDGQSDYAVLRVSALPSQEGSITLEYAYPFPAQQVTA